MNNLKRRLAVILALPLTVGLAGVGCSSGTGPGSVQGGATSNASLCAQLLADARYYVQSGQTSDSKLAWTLDEMSHRCPDELADLDAEVRAATEQSQQSEPTQEAVAGPSGATSWSEAGSYVGSTRYVCGPLASIRNSTDDVFMNIGLDYPDRSRFTIVLWDIGGIEQVATGTTVCVEGPITTYEGVAQIELRSTDAVELWE
ncbi:hypothetical protein FHE66_14520 [Georgenia sp. 311]|uniref:hypothetical protein n=1 Tax=Georgenia sp. 311 TaxID=2585134 RepID=UPI001111ADE4|nr:hypothetical protein [Georgenia sp. 311]TNC16590.1 hypothetical protein FHE66_14520 [Georgenia sp. 311]